MNTVVHVHVVAGALYTCIHSPFTVCKFLKFWAHTHTHTHTHTTHITHTHTHTHMDTHTPPHTHHTHPPHTHTHMDTHTPPTHTPHTHTHTHTHRSTNRRPRRTRRDTYKSTWLIRKLTSTKNSFARNSQTFSRRNQKQMTRKAPPAPKQLPHRLQRYVM